MLSSVILDELIKNKELIKSFIDDNSWPSHFTLSSDEIVMPGKKVEKFKESFSIVKFAMSFGILTSKMDDTMDSLAFQFAKETQIFMNGYMHFYNFADANQLCFIIDRYALIQTSLLKSYEICIDYIEKIRGENDLPEDSTITYTFSSNLSRVEEIDNLISTINRAYQLLCYIAGEDANTLHIIRIETGSLETIFTGVKKVITALGGIYKTILRYIVKHLHQDGAIMKNEELLKLLNSELQTYGLMKEQGLDVSKIDGSLQETLQTIAININELAQMPLGIIKINGELIFNDDEVRNLENPIIAKLNS